MRGTPWEWAPLAATFLGAFLLSPQFDEGRGYYGTPGTVTTYARETTQTGYAAASSTQVQTTQEAGTSGNNIEYQGGYSTATNLQSGETIYDGLNGNGYGIFINPNYITNTHLSCVRYSEGMRNYGSYGTHDIYSISNNTTYGMYTNGMVGATLTIRNANNNGTYGFGLTGASDGNTITVERANNNITQAGVYIHRSR